MNRFILTLPFLVCSALLQAHPGGQDSNGGHTNRSTGEYHCHRSSCNDSSSRGKRISSHNNGYDRSEWQTRWADADGDCQDTRHELLISTSLRNVTFKTYKQCRVVAGEWIDPYTNATFYNPKKLDIDHIIPLAYAARNGGNDWSRSKKKQFAEEPINLLVVSARENRSKSDKGPSRYLPPKNRCDYANSWLKIAKRYQLVLPPHDIAVIGKILKTDC